MKERFLGAGLSNRARYANDSGGCASARCRAQGIERRRRVVDQHMGMIDRPTDNRARRAGGKGLPDKAVPVSSLTGKSDKKTAGADFATVKSDAGNNARPRSKERRAGKQVASPCTHRWTQDHKQ